MLGESAVTAHRRGRSRSSHDASQQAASAAAQYFAAKTYGQDATLEYFFPTSGESRGRAAFKYILPEFAGTHPISRSSWEIHMVVHPRNGAVSRHSYPCLPAFSPSY